MTSKILVLSLAALVIFGCSSNKEVPQQPEGVSAQDGGPGAQDTTIQSKDMSFDVQGSDSGNIAGLYTINFDYDKASMTADAKGKAQKNADWMKAHPEVTIQIEGHCDRHGSIEYNLALGERRARAVKAYMVNIGADANKLTTISYGKEKPLDTSETDAADAKNRRANFIVQK
jgi:peptidoglycan-associated lipoprotein